MSFAEQHQLSPDLVKEEDSTHQGSPMDYAVERFPSASGVKLCQEPASEVPSMEAIEAPPPTAAHPAGSSVVYPPINRYSRW